MRAPLALAAGLVLLAPSLALAHPCQDGSDGAYAQARAACEGDKVGTPNCGQMVARAISRCSERLNTNVSDKENDTSEHDRADHDAKIGRINGWLADLQRLQQQQQQAASQSSSSHGLIAGAALGGQQPLPDHGPAQPHGAPPYNPEQTQHNVQASLADGNIKGATDGAKQMLDNGDRKSAGPALDQIIKQDPNNPEARGLRAQSRLIDGDFSGALADARVVLKSDPGNRTARQIEAWAMSEGRDIHLKKNLALDFNSRGEAERGAGGGSDARLLASAMPGGGTASPKAAASGGVVSDRAQVAALSSALRSAAAADAWAKFKIGDVKGALALADAALAMNPSDVSALTLKAKIRNASGQPELALQAADAALKVDPLNVAALLERGYAKYSLGHYRDALSDVEQALSIDPLNAMGHLYRAMILERMERAQDAIREYVRAAELDGSLKPLVDDALARLGVSPTSAAGRAARRYWPVWGGALAVALGLLAFGLKRVIRPEWATPMTPSTPLR